MAAKKQLVQLDNQVQPNLSPVASGFVALGAKSDGMYQKRFGQPDEKLSVDGHTHSRIVDVFITTNGQTTFSTSVSYTVGNVDVFYNGAKLTAAEFTATNGTTVVLVTPARISDIVEIIISNFTNTTVNESIALVYSIVF